MTDGYHTIQDIEQKFWDMKNLLDKQDKIDKDLDELGKEMETMPEIPTNLDKWSESISPLDGYNFKLSDFSKMFKINRRYKHLIEERDKTTQLIKISVIDNLIDRIKSALK